MKTFWLSFSDPDRPAGQRFLGVCIVDVTVEMAAEAFAQVTRRWPHRQADGAEWLAAAIRQAHQLGCNPGGDVASWEVPPDIAARCPRNRLLLRPELLELGLVAAHAE